MFPLLVILVVTIGFALAKPMTSKATFRETLTARTPGGRTALYADEILLASIETGVSPYLLAAIMERETHSGTAPGYLPRGPEGTGDNGHGHGLMQIDDRSHRAFVESGLWRDAFENIRYAAASVMNPNLSYFAQKGLQGNEQIRAAVAAYNAGPGNVWRAIQAGNDPDSVTTGHNYSTDVLARMQAIEGVNDAAV